MNKISISDWLEDKGSDVLLDVRTPAEYAHGHIPGAYNLPLMGDDERAVVGTLYKQKGRDIAFLKALEFVGPKLKWYLKEALNLAPGRNVTVHCWRGGQRSGSLATLLQFSGFQVRSIEGGYKAYRKFVLEQFESRVGNFVVLGGKTGSGKTEVLKYLTALGEQIIDLENLAHHKGSAFGALGEAEQPSVEQFENELFAQFYKLDTKRRIWVENESRSIGKVFIPEGFWKQIRSASLINLEIPFELRVERLVRGYSGFADEELKAALLKIERRMGGQFVKAALEKLASGDYHSATAIVLNYYDKSYLHATSLGNFTQRFQFELMEFEAEAAALKLIDLANEHRL